MGIKKAILEKIGDSYLLFPALVKDLSPALRLNFIIKSGTIQDFSGKPGRLRGVQPLFFFLPLS